MASIRSFMLRYSDKTARVEAPLSIRHRETQGIRLLLSLCHYGMRVLNGGEGGGGGRRGVEGGRG